MDTVETPIAIVICMVAVVVGFTIGILIGTYQQKSLYQTQSIERGYAQYDPKTGAWGWLEKVSK